MCWQTVEQQFNPALAITSDDSTMNKIDQILESKKQGQDTTALEQQVDELVYELYRITEEERKAIEGVK